VESDVEHVVRVSARVPDTDGIRGLLAALRLVGSVGALEDCGTDEEGRRCREVEVVVTAPSANVAVGALMSALHEADALEGSEVTYDVLSR
jgi:hypothetical protein